MRKIRAVAVKELRQIARDPLSLLMLLGIPSVMLLLYGFALNFDVRGVKLAILDRDRSAASRELVSAFVNSTYFERTVDLEPGADVDRLLDRGDVRAVLVVPEDFARQLAAGREVGVQMLLDGANASTASTVLGYASGIIQARNARLLLGPLGDPVPIDYQPRVWYNPELRSTQFLVPGLIGFILMLTAVLSTALSIVREKERGTMEQLRVTALGPGELLIGKTLPYLGISLVATAIIVLVARLLFGVVVAGSYLDLLAVTLLYLVGALGLGLLVSSVSDSQAMAFQYGSVVSMLPAIFLSGFIFPIRSMPVWLQAITHAVPARYFLVVLRGIMLKGAGLGPYLVDVGFLAAYAGLVWAIAWRRLVRKER